MSAYADLASDTTAPTTTTDVTESYWNDVTITATATDDEGIAYVYHEQLQEAAESLGLSIGIIMRSPMEGLINFHTKK